MLVHENKQKVPPILALFSNELVTALKNENGEVAEGTFALLRMMNNCTMQPILTLTASKG